MALVVVGAVAVAGCTQEQSDAAADDIGRVLLYFLLFALVFALIVVALVMLAGGMIAKGLHGLRNPPAAPTLPGQTPAEPPAAQPDRSAAWGTLIAGTVLAVFVLPIAFQISGGRASLVSLLPIVLVVGAVLLIRRGPPGSAPPPTSPAPPAPFAYPPPPPPPPPPSPANPPPPPAAAPRRRAPLRAPGREAGTHPPRKRN